MKRFYCTICKRVKRVRKYPLSVEMTGSDVVALRKGMCSWHHPMSITARARELASMKGGK
jgi:hypothetical protein